MTQAPAAIVKIPTKIPQPAVGRIAKPTVEGPSTRAKKASDGSQSPVFASGNGRAATRGSGEVIELEHGITVYPARHRPPAHRAG